MLWGPLSKPRQTLMEISPPDIVKRRVMTSGGATAEVVRATRRAKIELRFRAPLHLLAMYEQGVQRKLVFVPADHEYRDWQEPKMLLRAVCFYFEPARMPNPGEAMAPRPFFEDAALADTALKVARLIESPRSDIGPYFEALCAVLAHELMRLGTMPACGEAQVKGGLAPWQRRAVVDYIEEHLGEPIPLATLAALARLSPHHFCRAFKQTFGTPPHRYHTSWRIEQAKALLAKPSSSVTEVGLTMGFQETSSFTVAFHKTTGLTPTAYRRSLL
jgi:AraC family transcriptional regulator